MKTLYDVLGVTPQASDSEIKSAFRQLARTFHSDVAGESGEERFREVEQAYSVLRDPAKRAEYDAKVRAPTTVSELLLRHEVGGATLAAVLSHAPAQARRGNDLVRAATGSDPRPNDGRLRWGKLSSQGARGQNSGVPGDLFLYNAGAADDTRTQGR